MNIFTERVKNKTFKGAVDQELLKKSQELYVLAVLRYLDEKNFQNFIHSDSPDIRSINGELGIEVTTACSNDEMRVSREFSRINKNAAEDKNYKKSINTIESFGYKIHETRVGKIISSPTHTEKYDQDILTNAITNKLGKIKKYRKTSQKIGLAIIFQEPVSSMFKDNYINWIKSCTSDSENEDFDFYYIFCNRMVLFYSKICNRTKKIQLSEKESKSLQTIARMTAEGELSFSDIEWQNKTFHDTHRVTTSFDPSNPKPLITSQKAELEDLSNLADDTVRKKAVDDPDCEPLD